jgi:predicted nucleic acid-binding protein
MKAYLDTSVILAYFLESNASLDRMSTDVSVGSSRLLWVEFSRVLDRALRGGTLKAEEAVDIRRGFEETSRTINRLRLTEGILQRAEASFPLVIRTLDALHLASAVAWLGQDDPMNMEIWTLDRQFNLCAAAMGFVTPLLERGR